MIVEHEKIENYLKATAYIDCNHPDIVKKADELRKKSANEHDYIKNAYLFVRDKITHSWDAQDKRVSILASDVLKNGTGICWTKSNLLAALLRAGGVPAGISHQHVTIGDTPDTGYCIHALNTVYLNDEHRWIRLDARGNKATVHAEYDLNQEKLAFEIREEYGEIDYHDNHQDADERLMMLLKRSDNVLEVQSDVPLGKFIAEE